MFTIWLWSDVYYVDLVIYVPEKRSILNVRLFGFQKESIYGWVVIFPENAKMKVVYRNVRCARVHSSQKGHF